MYIDTNYPANVGTVSLTATVSTDIKNGALVCPNLPVEFRCDGVNVTFLQWGRNGNSIYSFSANDNEGHILDRDSFTLSLDNITLNVAGTQANMTSRLIGIISNFISGDRVTCAAFEIEDNVTLKYTVKGKH